MSSLEIVYGGDDIFLYTPVQVQIVFPSSLQDHIKIKFYFACKNQRTVLCTDRILLLMFKLLACMQSAVQVSLALVVIIEDVHGNVILGFIKVLPLSV